MSQPSISALTLPDEVKVAGTPTNGQVPIYNSSQQTYVPGNIDLPTGNIAPFVNVASATTTDIGAALSESVQITGTTTITGLGTAVAGTKRRVRFAGVLTLTHNGTSLILPGAANITTAANDCAFFVSLGSGNWICTDYQRASGAAVVASGSRPAMFAMWNGNSIDPSATMFFANGMVSSGEQFAAAFVATEAATISRFFVRTSDTQPANGALTLRVRKNGVNTTIVITIAAGSAAGVFSDVVNSFTVVAGDVITISAQNGSGSLSSAVVRNFSLSINA